jgi:hypothetical protein
VLVEEAAEVIGKLNVFVNKPLEANQNLASCQRSFAKPTTIGAAAGVDVANKIIINATLMKRVKNFG